MRAYVRSDPTYLCTATSNAPRRVRYSAIARSHTYVQRDLKRRGVYPVRQRAVATVSYLLYDTYTHFALRSRLCIAFAVIRRCTATSNAPWRVRYSATARSHTYVQRDLKRRCVYSATAPCRPFRTYCTIPTLTSRTFALPLQ